MTKIIAFVLFLIPGIFFGQDTVLNSPFTQNFQSGRIESINRTISVGDDKITIITDTPEGKDFYVLNILEVEQKPIDGKPHTVFHCETEDNYYPTTLVYSENEGAPYVDVFQPALENPQKVERFRFLLD